MANFTCPSCRQISRDVEIGSACLFCGRSFKQFRQAPLLLTERIDLVAVARIQRALLVALPFVIGLQVLCAARPSLKVLQLSPIIFAIVAALAMAGGMLALCIAMQSSPGTIAAVAILGWIPIIGLLAFLLVNSDATRALQKAGLSVGVLGVGRRAVRNKLDPRYCNECGYDLTGNASGTCSECGHKFARARG